MITTEPVGVSEIARRLEVDKAGVSRVMAALEREGWVARTGLQFVLGTRTLAMTGAVGATEVLTAATRVVETIHEETGLAAVTLQLAGRMAQPIAIAGPELIHPVRAEEGPFEHLVATAGGVALLAQLPDDAVRSHLAIDPWPRLRGNGPEDAPAARELVEDTRREGIVSEREWTIPGLACLAAPWDAGDDRPRALAVVGSVTTVESQRSRVEGLFERAGVTAA